MYVHLPCLFCKIIPGPLVLCGTACGSKYIAVLLLLFLSDDSNVSKAHHLHQSRARKDALKQIMTNLMAQLYWQVHSFVLMDGSPIHNLTPSQSKCREIDLCSFFLISAMHEQQGRVVLQVEALSEALHDSRKKEKGTKAYSGQWYSRAPDACQVKEKDGTVWFSII